MSISSIASSGAVSSLQKPPQPEVLEPRRAGPDHDGDKDDSVGSASAPKPVVNTSGQTTGILINTTA